MAVTLLSYIRHPDFLVPYPPWHEDGPLTSPRYLHHVPHADQAHHQDYIQQTLDHPHTLHHYTIYGMYIWRVCSWLFVLNISYKEFLAVFAVSITRREQVSKMLVTEIACIMLYIMFLCVVAL